MLKNKIMFYNILQTIALLIFFCSFAIGRVPFR